MQKWQTQTSDFELIEPLFSECTMIVQTIGQVFIYGRYKQEVYKGWAAGDFMILTPGRFAVSTTTFFGTNKKRYHKNENKLVR